MSSGGGGTTNATSNTVTQPWAGQEPYLNQAFGGAQSLYSNYTPQYYPGTQIAPFTPGQAQGSQAIINQAQVGEPITGSAMNFATGLQNGSYFGGPNNATLSGLQDPSIVIGSNPGYNYFGSLLSGGGATANNPANATLMNQAGGGGSGSDALKAFSSGSLLSQANPYAKATTDAITAQTLPAITSTFVKNGSINNPASAYAASQGLASALAPFQMQNYQQGLQQVQSAAQQQMQDQQSAASALGQNYLGGFGANTSAAANQSQAYQQGLAGILGAASQQGNQYQDTLGKMAQSLYSSPQIQQMAYYDPTQQYTAGAQQQAQAQNQINAAMQNWNYNQTLPYNILNNYLGSVGGGSFGSNTQQTTPYQDNTLANIIGYGGAALAAGSGIASLAGYASLGAMLSDRRSKENIKKIGLADNGLPIYSFNYIGSTITHIGFMADEVETIHPEAVFDTGIGRKMVNYAMAVLPAGETLNAPL